MLFNTARFGAQAVSSGDTVTLFAAADSLVAGSQSVVIAPADSGPVPRGLITFQANFASAPTAVVEIFGSNTPPTAAGPQNGVVLTTFTNAQASNYTDNLAFAFYWAQLVSQSGGGALTLTAHLN